jgi:hypothetical protein
LTQIQLHLIVESVLYKLDVPKYKKVSYPKQRNLLVLHIFVMSGLLNPSFTWPGNSLPDFLPGHSPGFLHEIVPNSLPESLLGTLLEHVTQIFTQHRARFLTRVAT